MFLQNKLFVIQWTRRHLNAMALQVEFLTLDEPDFVETLLRCFAANARTKKLRPQK